MALTRRQACRALTRNSRASGGDAEAAAPGGGTGIEVAGSPGIKRSSDRPDAFTCEIGLLRGQGEEGLFQRPVLSALPAQVVARADGDEAALVNDADAVGHFLGHA